MCTSPYKTIVLKCKAKPKICTSPYKTIVQNARPSLRYVHISLQNNCTKCKTKPKICAHLPTKQLSEKPQRTAYLNFLPICPIFCQFMGPQNKMFSTFTCNVLLLIPMKPLSQASSCLSIFLFTEAANVVKFQNSRFSFLKSIMCFLWILPLPRQKPLLGQGYHTHTYTPQLNP